MQQITVAISINRGNHRETIFRSTTHWSEDPKNSHVKSLSVFNEWLKTVAEEQRLRRMMSKTPSWKTVLRSTNGGVKIVRI